MKMRGSKVREIKKPKRDFFIRLNPFNRDKIKSERAEEISKEKYYNYDNSQALNNNKQNSKKAKPKVHRRQKKNRNI